MQAVLQTNDQAKRPSILIVDDELPLREAVQKALKKENYKLLFAENGAAALEIMKEAVPDLIFLDLLMPVMDGITFLEKIQIKTTDPYMVIIITGHGIDQEIQQCYNLGANFFLKKPLNMIEICCLAKKCIEFKRLEQEREQFISHLQKARHTIEALEDILPICASCKKIRDEEGKWHEVESYIKARTRCEFSHGICPGCIEKLYPGFNNKK